MNIIVSRLGTGMSVAIPAAVLCINRRLYILASVDSVLHYSTAKRREVIIDLAIGIGLPILEMILFLSGYCLYVSLAYPYYSVLLSNLSICNCQRLWVQCVARQYDIRSVLGIEPLDHGLDCIRLLCHLRLY